jgi:hypothetical protein
MYRSAIAALLAMVLLATPGHAVIRIAPAAADDELVTAAILDTTIIPAHKRANSDATVPLSLIGEITPLCLNRPADQPTCRIPDQWRRYLEPDTARNWAGLVPDERVRNELIASFETRNTESHRLPLTSHPGIVVLDSRNDPPATPLDRGDRRTSGSGYVSLPGYSSNRHALAVGSYSCGSLCGYAWLFVLERVDGHWRVKSATITAIS